MESVAICQHNTTNSDTEDLLDVVFFGLSENSSELIRMHYMQISYSVAELIYGVHLCNVIFRIKWFVSKVKHLNNRSHWGYIYMSRQSCQEMEGMADEDQTSCKAAKPATTVQDCVLRHKCETAGCFWLNLKISNLDCGDITGCF